MGYVVTLFGNSLLLGITEVTLDGLRSVSSSALLSTIFICFSDAK